MGVSLVFWPRAPFESVSYAIIWQGSDRCVGDRQESIIPNDRIGHQVRSVLAFGVDVQTPDLVGHSQNRPQVGQIGIDGAG